MTLIDYIIIGILIFGIIIAFFSYKKRGCGDCSRCQRECGGKGNGRKFKSVNENKGKSIN